MSEDFHRIVDGKFVCSAPKDAPCRNYPACECEHWSIEVHGVKAGAAIGFENGHAIYSLDGIPPQPGHESVPQDECWIAPWLDAVDLEETYSHDGDEAGFNCSFPDGPVEVEFHGDWVTWEYSDATEPVSNDEEADGE